MAWVGGGPQWGGQTRLWPQLDAWQSLWLLGMRRCVWSQPPMPFSEFGGLVRDLVGGRG